MYSTQTTRYDTAVTAFGEASAGKRVKLMSKPLYTKTIRLLARMKCLRWATPNWDGTTGKRRDGVKCSLCSASILPNSAARYLDATTVWRHHFGSKYDASRAFYK